MAAMGLGYPELRELKSDTILCSISALGQTGPLAHKPGYDYIAQGYAGVTSMTGSPDEAPYITAVGLGDVSTGAHAALAILAALRHRDRTGEGQHLDVALLDVYYHCHEENVTRYSGSGGRQKPRRAGRHMTYLCPAGVFRATGGEIVIMGHGRHWSDLCRAMERSDLARHKRFRNDPARVAIRDEVVATIESWLARFPDVESALAHLARYDVPSGPVLSVEETVHHPHLRQRGTVRTIHDAIHGDFDVPGMPLRFSAFPDALTLEAPSLGQHNAEVLCERLGLGEGEIQELRDAGVLIGKP
jgi:crotonobetainyl-CoA:carnitine CoA-transferase CaiB-like acyl-CoA transferase